MQSPPNIDLKKILSSLTVGEIAFKRNEKSATIMFIMVYERVYTRRKICVKMGYGRETLRVAVSSNKISPV